MNQNGSGFLRVRVTEASGTLPIEGAVVRITDYPAEGESDSGRLLYSLRSNADGLTPVVSLPAPPQATAVFPGRHSRTRSTIFPSPTTAIIRWKAWAFRCSTV